MEGIVTIIDPVATEQVGCAVDTVGAVGKASFLIITSSVDVHAPFVIVHLNVLV